MSHCPIRGHLHQSYPGVKIPIMDQWGMFPIRTPDKHFFPRFSAVGGQRSATRGKSQAFSGQRRGPCLGVVAELVGESLCSSAIQLRDETGWK